MTEVVPTDGESAVIIFLVGTAVPGRIAASTPPSGRRTSSFVDGIAFGFEIDPVTVFLGKRGDSLTDGWRLTAAGLRVVTAGLAAIGGLIGGCGRLGVLGDLADTGDLGGTGLCGVVGPGGNFFRGDGFADVKIVGAGGGLPTTDKSFVDTESRCLSAAGFFRLPVIRGSDDCRLSGSDIGLDARDRPFSGVLKPWPRNGLTRPLQGCLDETAGPVVAGGSGNTTNAPRSLRRGLDL